MKINPELPSDEELRRLANLYHLEQYLFETVSQRFRTKQTLTDYDFFAIIIWKSNRSKTKVKNGLSDAGKTASQLMKEVSQASSAQAKLETLTRIRGIGLPIASAILSVCYPDEFTVLDYRVWETLEQVPVDDLPRRPPKNAAEYLQYCQVCQQLASQTGLSLRDLDRALWAKSWENGLFELLEK